jgi:hypothetical protein
MRQRDALIGAGLGAFAAGTVALLPAHVALKLLGTGARISGASGTLWSGTADAIQLDALQLGRTEWSLRPLALFRGRLAADVTTQWAGGSGHGDVAIGLGKSFACNDCEISTSLVALRPIAAVPALGGKLDLTVRALDISEGWPRRAIGVARVTDMPLSIPGQAQSSGAVGSYEVAFNADPVAEDGRVEGTVTDLDGPLQVTARLQLTPPGNYQLAGTAQARPDAPPALRSGLALLGPPRADGSREFAFSGTW